MLKKKLNNYGETIVEVLICIVVLAVGLTSAYTISNLSNKTILQNEGQYQAQLYAQKQINLIHLHVNDSAYGLRSRTALFYLDVNPVGNVVTVSTSQGLISPFNQASGLYFCIKTDNLGIYDNSGLPSGGVGSRSLNEFKVTVTWAQKNSHQCTNNNNQGTLVEYYAA